MRNLWVGPKDEGTRQGDERDINTTISLQTAPEWIPGDDRPGTRSGVRGDVLGRFCNGKRG